MAFGSAVVTAGHCRYLRGMSLSVNRSTVVMSALAFVTAAVLTGCGSARQNVHVQRDVARLDASTRFDPVSLMVPDEADVYDESRDVFDAALDEQLSRRGLLGSMGEAGTLEVRPSVVSYQIKGGIERSFFATQGSAVIRIEVVLIDRDGRKVGHLRATERSEVSGVLPKVVNPELLRGAAEALAEDLAAAVGRTRKELH